MFPPSQCSQARWTKKKVRWKAWQFSDVWRSSVEIASFGDRFVFLVSWQDLPPAPAPLREKHLRLVSWHQGGETMRLRTMTKNILMLQSISFNMLQWFITKQSKNGTFLAFMEKLQHVLPFALSKAVTGWLCLCVGADWNHHRPLSLEEDVLKAGHGPQEWWRRNQPIWW